MKKREKYEVFYRGIGEWLKCKAAVPQPSGWLHYELWDGTNGLARPGAWRVVPGLQEQGR